MNLLSEASSWKKALKFNSALLIGKNPITNCWMYFVLVPKNTKPKMRKSLIMSEYDTDSQTIQVNMTSFH